MFPPRLIMIGAQKAGTTSLADWLDQHPEITAGKEKEPDFYTRFWARGLNWYRENYSAGDSHWLLDASTSYSAGFVDPDTGSPYAVAERIKEIAPDARLLYLLRDPVARAYSSYWHSRRLGMEKQSLRRAISIESPYAEASKYVQHLEYFLEHFEKEQILVLDFADLCTDKAAVLRQVTDFLEISPADAISDNNRDTKNKGFQYSGVANVIRKISGSEQNFRGLVSFVRRNSPSFLHQMAIRIFTNRIPPISTDDRQWLAEMFEQHTRRLEQLLGRSFKDWARVDGTIAPQETTESVNPALR